jgi:hypothetical protein
VGWLMIISGLDFGGLLQWLVGTTEAAPPELNPGLLLALWVGNWSWVIFIFPIFLIPLYFPDGKLPIPRWGWVFRLAVVLGLFLAVTSLFTKDIGPIEGSWTLPNPIGFIPEAFYGSVFLLLWGIGLLAVVAGSVASLVFRYRRAQQTERDQIKWLLYAGLLFFAGYGVTYFMAETTSDEGWSGPVFIATLMLIPIAIAIAILRHRLYDINLIIRRTLQYSLLTGLLALVYFGGIVLLQELFGGLAGDSPLVTVITTLATAALFSPLRRGTQRWIDRRFFRAKYDAERALANFAAAARDAVELDKFTAALMDLTNDTLRPDRVSLWLRLEARRRSRSE